MDIRFKIVLAFAIILLFLIISFFYNQYYLGLIIKQIKLLNLSERMVENLLQIRRHEKNFIVRGQMEWAEITKSYLIKLNADMEEYAKYVKQSQDLEELKQIRKTFEVYTAGFKDYVDKYKNKQVRPESEILITSARELEKLLVGLSNRFEKRLLIYFNKITNSRILVLTLSFLVAIGAFEVTSRTIITPLKKLQLLCQEITEKITLGSERINIVESQLKDINFKDEIGKLARAYMAMVSRWNNASLGLQQKIKETEGLYKVKSEFTSMVSHELRTPLTAIKEGIDYVFDGSAGDVNAEQKEFLEIAKRNVDRLARLINDVLDFSKLTSHHVEMKFEMASINEIIESVINVYRLVMEKEGLQLRANLNATQGLMLLLDPDRINQVLSNLINNAIKFTEKGTITISTVKEERANVVRICVEDTGIGVRKADFHRLFQPFTQLQDKRTRKPGGTGLGLAISKQIIELSGGSIWAESEEGKGSRFYFILPLKERRKIKIII